MVKLFLVLFFLHWAEYMKAQLLESLIISFLSVDVCNFRASWALKIIQSGDFGYLINFRFVFLIKNVS